MEQQPVNTKKGPNFKLIIGILSAVLVILIGVYALQANKWSKTNRLMETERDSLALNLSNMLWEYENVRTTNQTISAELEVEKEKIQTLLEEMRRNEAVNFSKLRQYEKETNTLREIMRSYIKQIDSLNTLNQQLIAENMEVKQSLIDSKSENQKLAEEKSSLAQQIEKGSQLRVRNIEAIGLNKRDKDTHYASRSEKLRACFIINENTITTPGVRNAYIVIKDPTEKVLPNASGATIEVRDSEEPLVYSAVREIDYQNQDLETCIYYDIQEAKLAKGKYEVQVYIDRNLGGQADFLLK
jgi:hypothetical protein